jgi:polar amino acid transport system substrate-binding protein
MRIRGDYMKKIFGLLLLSFVAISLSACQESVINDWDQLVERGYVIVGLDDTFAPMGFRDETGALVGFDVDLAKQVFESLNIEVRFQPIDWDAKVLELDSGTIDMIWNGLTITEARKEEMLFSDPYLANRQIVLTRIDQTINTIDALSGLEVGVQISSASESAVRANAIFSQLGELVQYDTFNQALLDLKNGTIDAVVIDEIMGRYIISQQPDTYRVMSEDFGNETYGIGFRLASTTIRDLVNQTLFDLIEDGTLIEVSKLWFDEDILLRS